MVKMDFPNLCWCLLFLLFACKNNPPEESPNEAAAGSEPITAENMDSVYTAELVAAPNPRNAHWYTYRNDGEASENSVARSGETQVALDSMYEISETARPPLFNKNCLTAAKPEQCSNEAVLDWMQYAVERPAVAAERKKQVIHYVLFTIDEKGKAALTRIISVKQPCEPCIAATREAIAGMPDWIPATRDGQPVKVQITLPVYYD